MGTTKTIVKTIHMASSKIVRDSRPMSPCELPKPVVEVDTNESTNGSESGDDEHYNMSHKHRGKLIIFNHESFNNVGTNFPERKETGADRRGLEEVFLRMNFTVDVCNDFSAGDIINKLQHEADRDASYRKSDCLVVVVMTHGEKGDRIWANDRRYSVETLWETVMGKSRRALAGIPKIFIIQASRSADRLDELKVEIDGRKVQPNNMTYSISEPDILIAYNSYVCKLADRHRVNGTSYIHKLCQELKLNGKTDDLLSILTNVNRHIAVNYENTNFKHMPTIQSTLTRKVFLNGTSGASNREKLEEILERVRELKGQPRRLAKRPRPSSEWDAIKPENQSFEITQSDEQVMKMAAAVKSLLSDESRSLRTSVRMDGETILNLVAVWGSLSHDVRCFALGRLDTFLRAHGTERK